MMTGHPSKSLKPQRAEYCSEAELGESQWINCDIRNFRMDILGQYGVIMADPPWDIHMELPYGTMADDEMRNLNIQALQTDGLIFLWVTGRAMELGREWYAISPTFQKCDHEKLPFLAFINITPASTFFFGSQFC